MQAWKCLQTIQKTKSHKIHLKNDQTECAELKHIKTETKKTKTFKGDKVTEERANWKVRNIAQYTSWRGKIMVEFYYLFNGNSKEKGDRENKPETIFQPLLAKNSLGQIHRSTNS